MKTLEATIGVEVHVELKTKSKIFSSSENGYGVTANSCTNVIDLGYPGTLPTLNKEVLNLAIKAATIFHCDITKLMHFDRKNYFYPDNPKNFQITQARTPIGRNGYIEIEHNGFKKRIEIEEMHIEEDTCKSTHKGTASYLDFNRAGVPLIEIVTKPCMHDPEEAVLYLEKLRELLYYADISDCKIEEGSMRCDANVSLSEKGSSILGTKCEVKNIGSIHNVGVSIDYEIKRQKECLEKGETLKEQTRRFDDKSNQTILMRVKETGNDYRYFPEPDIPYVEVTDQMIEDVKKEIPMLPDERRKVYTDLGLTLLNANKLIQNRPISDYFNTLLEEPIDFVMAGNLLLQDISAYLNKTNKKLADISLRKERFLDLLKELQNGSITNKMMKDLLVDYLESEKTIQELVKEKGMENISDTSLLSEIVQNIIKQNPQSIEDFKAGRDRAVKYLMGQVMKETKGQANPAIASQILMEELKKL